LIYGTGLDGVGGVISTGNIGIGVVDPSEKLEVGGGLCIDGICRNIREDGPNESYVYRDVCSWGTRTEDITGTCKITLPAHNTDMLTIKLGGYDYTWSTAAWEVFLGGYLSASTGRWARMRGDVAGAPPFSSIRVANDASGKPVILLGTTSTAWKYPSVYVKEICSHFHSLIDFSLGATVEFITDESGLTDFYDVPTPFVSTMPAPTADNQLLQATGAGAAAWTTDIEGLTSLVVDTITLDGSTISSTDTLHIEPTVSGPSIQYGIQESPVVSSTTGSAYGKYFNPSLTVGGDAQARGRQTEIYCLLRSRDELR
jgi:hypothetical protein